VPVEEDQPEFELNFVQLWTKGLHKPASSVVRATGSHDLRDIDTNFKCGQALAIEAIDEIGRLVCRLYINCRFVLDVLLKFLKHTLLAPSQSLCVETFVNRLECAGCMHPIRIHLGVQISLAGLGRISLRPLLPTLQKPPSPSPVAPPTEPDADTHVLQRPPFSHCILLKRPDSHLYALSHCWHVRHAAWRLERRLAPCGSVHLFSCFFVLKLYYIYM
jgi:hypothetical protein